MAGPSLHDVGEAGFLRLLRRRMHKMRGPVAHWQVGLGDDAAILGGRHNLVVTTDMLVEDVDFRRRWATWRDVGHKAAAVNLSDLAAMGAVPRGLTVALAAAPEECSRGMLQLLLRCHAVGTAHGAPLVGGDLSQTRGPVVVSVTALGSAPRRPLQRHCGRVGDRIMVTGTLGGAAAGLQLLEHPALQGRLPKAVAQRLIQRQLRPNAQCRAAVALSALGVVHTMADISDGLHQDVRHLLPPQVGATLDMDALPIERGVGEVALCVGQTEMDLALCGGEDFELVFALPERSVARAVAACQALGVLLTDVGSVTHGPKIVYRGHAATAWRHGHGFRHFT